DQAYLVFSPAAVSESVVESELFGHVKGAFTGASVDRQGLVELASGGTLLLDEIGDLPMSLQIKLLRMLEQGEFTPVGDVKPQKCDVRCIAATNRDLNQAVRDGVFREDLLYRLSAVSIHLPPLRSRPEDIPLLCDYFLRRLGHSSPSTSIDDETMAWLQQRKWWGNVRELRNAIDHVSVVARGRTFEVSDFPEPQSASDEYPSHTGLSDSAPSPHGVIQAWTKTQLEHSADGLTDLHEKFLAVVEPALLEVVLNHTDGNRAAAAELLGIHRGTLRERLKRYGVA
ncbi:MAG: sigma 54-interacting transcriptional regulator, partial [Rubripirellula sp.]